MVVDQCQPYYRPQTKLRKGNVFTSVCQEFCPQGRGCVCQTPLPLAGRHSPGQTPPRQADTPPTDTPLGRHPSPWQADTPLGRHPHYPCRRPLQWTIRILLECILVFYLFSNKKFHEIDKSMKLFRLFLRGTHCFLPSSNVL